MTPHTGLSSFKSPVPPAKKARATAEPAGGIPVPRAAKKDRPFSVSKDIRETRNVRQMKTSTQHPISGKNPAI